MSTLHRTKHQRRHRRSMRTQRQRPVKSVCCSHVLQWRLFRADTRASAAHARMRLRHWTVGVHCAVAPSEQSCVYTISALFVWPRLPIRTLLRQCVLAYFRMGCLTSAISVFVFLFVRDLASSNCTLCCLWQEWWLGRPSVCMLFFKQFVLLVCF